MDGKLPLRGTFVFHVPPSLEGGAFHKTRYSSIAGCRHRWAWLTVTSLSFPVPEAIISVSYLLKEPDPVVPHCSGALPRALRCPRLLGCSRCRSFAENQATSARERVMVLILHLLDCVSLRWELQFGTTKETMVGRGGKDSGTTRKRNTEELHL